MDAKHDQYDHAEMTLADYRALVEWLIDEHRKPPSIAFTSGRVRWAADAVVASGILKDKPCQTCADRAAMAKDVFDNWGSGTLKAPRKPVDNSGLGYESDGY